MTGEGRKDGPTVVIGPGQRKSVNLDAFVDSFDVAVVIEALDRRVSAAWAMYFTHPWSSGATLAKAVGEPLYWWVVAEGPTEGEFSTCIPVANASRDLSAVVVVSGRAAVVVERSVYSPARIRGDATTGPSDRAFP